MESKKLGGYDFSCPKEDGSKEKSTTLFIKTAYSFVILIAGVIYFMM